MKFILRTYFFYLFALWIAQELLQPSFFVGDFLRLVIVAAILSGMHVVLVPIAKLILMPFYGLTFGLFGIVVNSAILYGVLHFAAPGAVLGAWTFQGLNTPYVTLPPSEIPLLGTVVLAAILMGIITKTLAFLVE